MTSWDPTGPVVVEIDGSADGLRLVDYALAASLNWGVGLVLVTPHAVGASSTLLTSVPTVLPTGEPVPAGVRSAVERAQETAGSAVPLTLATDAGPRFKVLAKAARRARLLVVGGSGARGSRGLAAAQSALSLASHAGCPTAVIPVAWQRSTSGSGVVVGVDGTALSTEALEFAFRAATEREVPLTVVHSARRAASGVRDAELHAERILSELLAGWSDQYAEVELRRRSSRDSAAPALLSESEEAELLVLGAQAEMLGAVNPVARRVVAGSKCPVVIVPHRFGATEQGLSRREVRRGRDVVPPTY